jgi:protein-S-isoprenylcysteine O-methyltransferase Ste14
VVNGRGVLALVLQVGFLAAAFAGRMILHRRRTGDWGFRWQRHDRVARVSGTLFAAALVIGTVGVALVAFSVTPPWGALDGVGVLVAGLAVFSVGCVLTLVAQSAMRRSWRIGVDPTERTALSVDGPFGWARNPIFTGMVTAAVGLALLAPTVLTIAAVFMLWVAVEIQVRSVEEPYLRVAMPDWLGYARRVGRFVPRLGRIGG